MLDHRPSRVSAQQFFLSELEISYGTEIETLPNLQNYESLKVTDCPTFESALGSIPLFASRFFVTYASALCLHFTISCNVEYLTEKQFQEFFQSMSNFTNFFIVIFEQSESGSCVIYWRLKNTSEIFEILPGKASKPFTIFLKEFLVKSVKNGHNGKK